MTVWPSQTSSQRRRRARAAGGSSWSRVQWRGPSLAPARPLWTEWKSSCRWSIWEGQRLLCLVDELRKPWGCKWRMFFSGDPFSKSDLNSFLFYCSSFASLKRKMSETEWNKNKFRRIFFLRKIFSRVEPSFRFVLFSWIPFHAWTFFFPSCVFTHGKNWLRNFD